MVEVRAGALLVAADPVKFNQRESAGGTGGMVRKTPRIPIA
jgi:hypothetical protein